MDLLCIFLLIVFVTLSGTIEFIMVVHAINVFGHKFAYKIVLTQAIVLLIYSIGYYIIMLDNNWFWMYNKLTN